MYVYLYMVAIQQWNRKGCLFTEGGQAPVTVCTPKRDKLLLLDIIRK